MHTTRQMWYAVGITFFVITTIVSAAFITNPSAFFPDHSDRKMEGTNTRDLRTGTIRLETDPDHCEQTKFDNVTGRIAEPRPCDDRIISDLRGIPVPKGTWHRLEGIRESFPGGRN